MLVNNILQQERYEIEVIIATLAGFTEEPSPGPTRFHTEKLIVLMNYPQQLLSGLCPSPFLVLRKLGSNFRGDGSEYSQKLVLSVPSA